MTFTSRELSLLSNTDLLGYVRAENAKVNAKAQAEGWSFWTTMPECEDFLAEFANVYELELMYARGTYADAHKEAWGFKGYSNPEATLEQVEAEIEELAEMAAEEYRAEQEWLAEQKQMERDQIALGLTDTMACGEDVELEEWEVYEAKAEAAGY